MVRIKKAISLFAAIAMLFSIFVVAPMKVNAEGTAVELVVNPAVLLPDKINSAIQSDRTITVDVKSGYARNWKPGDPLTVQFLRNGETYSINSVSTNQNGEAITVVLPQTDITNIGGFDKRGGYSVNVKLDGITLGTGYLEIDYINFNNIEVREDEGRIHLNGTGLINFNSPTLYAEVYQSGNKISTSKQTDFMWGNFEFQFDRIFDLSTSYTLKLFDGGTDLSSNLPNGGVFTVTPILACSYNAGSPIISGDADAVLVIADRNNLWIANETLNLQINGPNGGYEITGLTASEDNVQFTTSSADNHTYPWPTGTYDARIRKASGELLGMALFYVGTSANILQGEVKDSSGNLVESCGNVNIERIEDGGYTSWQRQIFVLPDGKFYLPNNELGDGNYKASIAAPNTLQEADAVTKFNVTGGVITPNPITLQFQVPDITGTVKLPDGTTNCNVSVPISISDNSEMKNEINKIWTKTDGTFLIKLNTPGTYYLKAWPDWQVKAIPSSAKEIVYDGTSQSGIVLQFQLPQIAVTAKDPSGSPLTAKSFWIDIEPVDHNNWMRDQTIYQNQYLVGNMVPGKYNIYAVPEGNCGYSRSFPQTVTITETNPASPITLDIALTDTKLTGTVTGMTGRDGYVALYRKTYDGFRHMGGFGVADDGSYKIGGIDNGSYYIRAELHSDSPLRTSNGSSLMTPVTITDTPSTQNLTLGDTKPRLTYVSDMQNGEGKARVRVININGITRNPTENDSLRAEIVSMDGLSLSPKVEISGANNFMIRWDCMDNNNNETDIEINMPKDINIPAGTYKLNLYDINDPSNTGDDILIAPDLTDANRFEMLAGVETSNYGFFPSKTGQHTKVKAYAEIQPWASGDALDVAFVSNSGISTAAASVVIQPDNTLDITVPSLAEGQYNMIIKKSGKILARQYIEVGTPQVSFISSASDTDTNIVLEGQYMSVLMGSAIIKIYSGANLVQTVQKTWNMWGSLVAEYNEPLPAGNYTAKVWVGTEAAANLITLPNGGAFKVIKGLKSANACVLADYANGTTQTMSAYNGSVPWLDNQDLTLKLFNEWGKTGEAISIPLSDDAAVSGTDLTFQLPDDNKLANGKWRIEVYSGTDLIARGYFSVINSSEIAFSGTVTGAEGGTAAGAKIVMKSLDDKYYYEFYTDANGSYNAYWIYDPGTYKVWVEPKSSDPFMGLPEPIELTINDMGQCSTPVQNFVLPPARFINGTVSLPSGTAGSDIGFWIVGFSKNGTPDDKNDDMMGDFSGKIAAGSSSGNYVLKVPKNSASGYYLQMFPETKDYVGNYFYGDNGAKYSLIEATAVDVSTGDQSGKNITMAVGTTIQGSITIPDTVTIPAEGYGMNLFVIMDNGTTDKYDDWFMSSKVAMTSSTQSYTMRVPVNPAGKPYKVGYDADPYGILELNGYYKSTGTIYNDSTLAGPVDVSTGNATSINLTARIRNDVETRAGLITALVNKVGPEKFIQPTADEIITYGTTYADWGSMSADQKAALAIAVKNGIVKGTADSKISPNEFVTRAACMVILTRAGYALGARLVETQSNIYFNDIKEHWAQDAIFYMAQTGLVKGYEDGRFDPDGFYLSAYTDALLTEYVAKLATANATRAGFIAKIIYGLGTGRFTQPTQADIAGYASQFVDGYETPLSMQNAMAIAVKNNIISGNAEGMLVPNGEISRAEASAILCNIADQADPALALKEVRSDPSFTDVISGYWAKTAIDRLYRANIISGTTGSTFEPDKMLQYTSIGMVSQNFFNGINTSQAVISLQPINQTVTYGAASVTFSVQAAGENIKYQWKKDGVAIEGATSASYTINKPLLSNSGSYTVEIYTGTLPLVAAVTSEAATLTVSPKQLIVTGLTANNKTYDGTTSAAISGTAALSGIVGTDVVTLSGTPSAVFTDKNAADSKTVNVSGYTLSGADAAKYTLVQPVLKANIGKAVLTVTGLTANNKTYDGTTAAAISGTAALSGIVGIDDVTLSGTPSAVFIDKNAADGKTVNVSGYTLSGVDANQYTLTQPILKANIIKAALTATADNQQRGYGASNPAFTITYTGFVNGETVATSGITQPAAACTATAASSGGAYPITLTGGNGGTNYTLTLVNGTLAVVPGLPNVTFSFDGTYANKLKGSTTAMEYSFDGGTTWADCTADTDLTAQLGSISAENDIKVREKAVTGPPTVPAGVVLTIDILAAPAAPSLTVNYATEKVMSATALMEYKVDSGAYQTVSAAEAGTITGGINLSSIIPANGSPAKALTIRVKSTGHILSGVGQTINIPARPVAPIAPTVSQILPTSITLTASAGYEYTKNDGTVWQDGNIFNGLAAGTTYSFNQRVKATTSAFASEKSPALSVTYYTVTFVPNGGSPAPEIKAVVSGGKVTAPANMTKTGYTGGTDTDWYTSEDLSGIKYDFNTSITANTTLYAKWLIVKYKVTATATGGIGGVISPAAKDVAYGDNLTLTILPDTGYELTGFAVGGTNTSLNDIVSGKYLLSNIKANTAVEGTFSKKKYAVTTNAGTGGTITIDVVDGKTEHGSQLVVTVTAADGKKIGNVEYTMNGTTVTPELNLSNQFTIASVTGPVTINATFANVDKTELKNAIIASMSINSEAYLDEYRTAFISAQSAAILVLVKADATEAEVNAAATALSSATTNMNPDHRKAFTVTLNDTNLLQGQAEVDNVNPKYGDKVKITATAIGNNAIYKIFVNGIQVNGNTVDKTTTYTINNVTANIAVTVLFRSTTPTEVTAFKTTHAEALGLNITTVGSGDIDKINTAISAYIALETQFKNYLSVEYQLLKALKTYLDNKAKADDVITAITALSDDVRNLTFVNAVNSTIAKYFSLTPDQQKLVGIVNIYLLNKYKLEADVIFQKDLVDTARINHVKGLIAGLNTTIGQGGDIAAATIAYNAAKTAYDSLSTDLKTQITAQETNKLNGLKAAIDSANQTEAINVQNQINALTVVKSDMNFGTAEGYKKAIIEAKNAYDALTEAQKAFVSTSAKAKLTECFESVAVIIEKPVAGLDTSVSFIGISDKVSDMTVISVAGKEAAINQKLNTDGVDTARRTDMVLSITLRDSGNGEVQPDGKVAMKIKINAGIKNRKPKIMSLDSLNNLFEVPSWTTGSDVTGWYLEFETDHFSDYAVVSAVQNNNANLLSLSLDGVTLSPAFDQNTTSYTASVANSITSTVVTPVVEDTGKATVTGSGTWSLSVGANTKSIVVTAEDGTTKTYTVTVTRAAATSGGDTGGSTTIGTTTGIIPVLPVEGTTNTDKTAEPIVTKDGSTTTASFTAGAQTDEKTGITNADIDAKTVENLTSLAKKAEMEGQKAVVEIKVESSDATKSVSVDIPREAFNSIVTETNAALKVNAGLGTITFDSKAVEHLSRANEGDMSINISKVEASSLAPEVKSKVGERPVYEFSVKAGNTEITKFGDGAALISIPYTLKTGEKKNAIVVYYIDSKGKLITVRGKYDEATKTVNFKTNHFSRYAVGYNEVKFNDVSASAWYNEAVGFIAARGITTGTGSGNYEPDSNLTRGQYIVMIMKAYGIDPLENPADNFADSGNTYYTNYLASAKKLGITSGVGNNMYAPGKEITRQEMFVLLYNTLKAIGELPEANSGKALKNFSDSDKVAPWAKDAMTLFVQTGTISGSNGRLTPEDTSNRAQMAQVIYNLLIKL